MNIRELMNDNKEIIIFGAGQRGEIFQRYLNEKWPGKVIAFCDNNTEQQGTCMGGIPIYSIDNLKGRLQACLYIVSIDNEKIYQEIYESLTKIGITNIVALNDIEAMQMSVEQARENVAKGHENSMEEYFRIAEQDEAINIFWSKDSNFYRMFLKLDLSHILELACGRGRHVEKYINDANTVILVDILEKNIQHCKERFKNYSNITCYTNNGYNLSMIESDSLTSIFSYDSMVHFELLDIFSYMQETFRTLKTGGRALFHHSNNYNDYNAMYTNGTNARAFMSEKIFAHLATRARLTVIEQCIIDWGVPNLDCITLLEKRE